MENHIGALPRTPFPASRDFPSRGNEKIGGTGYCVTYDTDSQSRNVLASPLGEEGHEVAKGVQANWIHRGAPRPANPVRRHPAKSVWTVVRMIMILLFYVLSPFAQGAADWRSGPRWSILSVLCPVHPFPLRGTSPQGETRDMERKTGRHILHVPFRCIPPLVPYGTTFPPQFGGAAKGKRLNGQARRLTSPHLEVLCRTSTGAL